MTRQALIPTARYNCRLYGRSLSLPRAASRCRPLPRASRPFPTTSSTPTKPRALAAGNPLSFLHVSRAEIDLPPDTNPYADAVYAKAARELSAA